MNGEAFIDSNIFLYAFSDADPDKQAKAKILVLSEEPNIISVQVINEVSNNLLKRMGMSNEDILAFVADCYKRYQVADLSKETFVEAATLRTRHQFSYYDSIIVASAFLSGCSVLYSEDMQHNQVIAGKLTIINPFVQNIP